MRAPLSTQWATSLSLNGSFFFPSRQRDGGKASLRARPRHAEDQPTSDRGETTPPPAPARARSVNHTRVPHRTETYARRRAAASHAAPTACSRPGPPTTRSGGLRGRRTPSGRRATTHSTPQPAAQPCQPKLRLPAAQTGAQQSTAHSTHRRRARSTRRRARASNTHTRTARARRTPAQRCTQSTLAHSSSSSLPQSNPHTRARTLPTAGARIGRRREEPTGLKLTPQGTNEIPEGALGRRSLRHLDSSTS